MKELPRNPNTRPPYSDVYMELDYFVGQFVMMVSMTKEQ